MALTEKSANRKDLRAGIRPMEHRHFATIATIIRSKDLENNLGFYGIRDRLAKHFADSLAGTNPRFDRERFLAACKG